MNVTSPDQPVFRAQAPATHTERESRPTAVPPPPDKKTEPPRGITRRQFTEGVLGLIGLGVAGAVISQAERIQKFIGPQSIEDKFPIVLPQQNFTPLTPQEQQNLWQHTKTLDLDRHTFTQGFPFDQATINRNPNIRMDQQFDAISTPAIDANKLKQEGLKDVTTFSGLSKGDQYRLIYDTSRYEASIITLSIAGVRKGVEGNYFTPAYTTLLVYYRDKQSGKSDLGQTIAGLYAKSLVPNKPLPTTGYSSVFEDGVPAASETPILELTKDLQDWDGKNDILSGQKGQFMVRSIYQQEIPRAPIPLTTVFLGTPEGKIASTP